MNNLFGIRRKSPRLQADHTLPLDDAARRVLRNTYLLLSLCLSFSAAMAGMSVALNLPPPGMLVTMIGYFGLLFLVNKYQKNGLGVLWAFGLTGFMGYTLGPIISYYLKLPDGTQIVMIAMGGTAVIFMMMSIYALFTKQNLSILGELLSIGILVAFLAAIVGIFLQIPAFSLIISAVFVFLSSGMILYQTNMIVRGGERNYILATVTLFVSIFNLFTSLLHILGGAGSSD